MATILDVNVNSDLCPQDSINTFYSDTKNVESSESDHESVESDDSSCISSDSDSDCDRSQTDQQKVTITPVINTNFTPEDEKELRSQLNSLYLLLIKKYYNKPFLPDDPSFHPVNDPIYGTQNPSISGNLSYLYDCIIRKRVELIIDTGKRRALMHDDKLLLRHEIKKAPEHLICEKGKDLLIKLINNRMDSTQIEKSSAVLKKHIYHFIVHYLNEKLITFSKRNNPKDNNLKDNNLKDNNLKDNDIEDEEFVFFGRLITEEEHLEIQKKIHQLALINMEKNLLIYFKDKFEKHFSDFNHADFDSHVKNKLSEMYSISFDQGNHPFYDHPYSSDFIAEKLSNSDRSQTHTHSVINTSVTPIDYSPEEKELRAQLNSVYRLLLKKRYDEELLKKFFHFPPNFDDSVCAIRDLFISNIILNASQKYAAINVIWSLNNILEAYLAAYDKKRFIDQFKSTPEDTVDQKEKDLILGCIKFEIDKSDFENLLLKIKAHIDDITINYLSERILAFSRDFNLKNGEEFEFFNNLITQKENFNVQDKIYYTILEIMEKKVLGSDEDIKILQ